MDEEVEKTVQFAYVRYHKDGDKKCYKLDSTRIIHFKPKDDKDFDSKLLYRAADEKGNLRFVRIAFLAYDEEQLNQKILHERPKFPNVKGSFCVFESHSDESGDEDVLSIDETEKKEDPQVPKKKKQKKNQDDETIQKSKSKVASKVLEELVEPVSPLLDDSTQTTVEEHEDGKENETKDVENIAALELATGTSTSERKLDDENFWYEEVIKLRDRVETLEGDLKKEKDLNKRLQHQILRFMENRDPLQSLQPGSIAGNRNSMRFNPPIGNPLGIYSEENVDEIKENQPIPSHRSNKGQMLSVGYPQKPNRAPQRYDVFGTRVFLAEDVYIDNDMWEHLKTKKETLFVKDLLSYIVGENLNEYALKPKKAGNLDGGIECKQLPESIKNIVLACHRDHFIKKEMSNEEKKRRVLVAQQSIREKLSDSRKKK